MIIRVATEKDHDESSPLCLLIKYPIVRSVGDTDKTWAGGSAELSTTELANGFNESVATGLRDNPSNAQAEGMSGIMAQGIREEDLIIYRDGELPDEWWSEGQEASECQNFWTRQLLAARDKGMASDTIETP